MKRIGIDDIISIKDACALLGVQRNSIYHAIDTGKIRTVGVTGRRFLIRADVEAYKPRADAGKKRKAGGK